MISSQKYNTIDEPFYRLVHLIKWKHQNGLGTSLPFRILRGD